MIYPECQTSHLYFEGGKLVKTAPSSLTILSLDEALVEFATFFHTRSPKEGAQGAFIYAPPHTVLEGPLQIDLPEGIEPHLFFALGKGAQLDLALVQRGSGMLNFTLEPTATCTMSMIEEPNEGSSLSIHGTLKEGALFKSIGASLGSSQSQQTYHMILDGEHAEADLRGVVSLDDKRRHATHVLIHHKKPHTRSNQQFKGVLHGHGRSHFEGKIYVDPSAQKTEAYQLNNNLLFGDQAIATTEPNLEIFADDVKASHGATVGQIGEEELFYLQSRGIKRDYAQKLLIQGFTQEILEGISLPSARARALAMVG